MKVLFVSRLYWPHIGGVERHVEEIGRRLKVKGKSVTVVTTKYRRELKENEKRGGVEIIRFRQPKIKYFGLVYTWLWLLRNISLIKQSDIVHVHDVFIWYLPFRILFPKKVVYTTFHGWEGEYPIPGKNVFLKKIASGLSDKTIAVGEYIEKYYGIKPDLVTYGATELPKTASEKGKSVVYLGRLDKDTGLLVFLKLLKKLRGYKVDFCGEGELRKECEKLGRVHGFINPKPFLAKAYFCFAGGYLSILEAMAHKCLVVTAYDNSLKKDYFKMTPFSKWIICEGDAERLAEKISLYAEKKEMTTPLIDEGYNWIKEQTWDELTGQYLALWGIK